MKVRSKLAAFVVGLSMTAWCAAQAPISLSEIPPATRESEHPAASSEHAPPYAHPSLPAKDDNLWTGSMLIIVAGMFAMAIAAGIVRHAEPTEEQSASAHGHDDHGHDDHGHDDAHAAHAADHAHH